MRDMRAAPFWLNYFSVDVSISRISITGFFFQAQSRQWIDMRKLIYNSYAACLEGDWQVCYLRLVLAGEMFLTRL